MGYGLSVICYQMNVLIKGAILLVQNSPDELIG